MFINIPESFARLSVIHDKTYRCALILCVAIIIALALPGLSSAQTFRGTILGTVSDPNGAVIPDARVTARNVGTGLERTTVTDGFGNYTIAELPTGTYEIKVQRPGFELATVTGVPVEVAGEHRVDISLTVAGADTVVTVAEVAQVQTTTNTLGGSITTKEVADLPVNGRDFTKFLVLVPGAT